MFFATRCCRKLVRSTSIILDDEAFFMQTSQDRQHGGDGWCAVLTCGKRVAYLICCLWLHCVPQQIHDRLFEFAQ